MNLVTHRIRVRLALIVGLLGLTTVVALLSLRLPAAQAALPLPATPPTPPVAPPVPRTDPLEQAIIGGMADAVDLTAQTLDIDAIAGVTVDRVQGRVITPTDLVHVEVLTDTLFAGGVAALDDIGADSRVARIEGFFDFDGTFQATRIATGIERVSVASDGMEGNSHSVYHAISADGRYVAFGSDASNLVADDTNNARDIFVHDRETGTTERVSVTSGGVETNHFSQHPDISDDGRYVAFQSNASNLVAGDTNNQADIFVHDRQTDAIEQIVHSGTPFWALGTGDFDMSADGRYVAFDIFVYSASPSSPNAEFLGTDLVVYDHSTRSSTTIHSFPIDEASIDDVSVSADGRYVAFETNASNLVAGDTNNRVDVFVHDRQTGVTERVSLASDGTQGNGVSSSGSVSADGRYVMFVSDASNLVLGDTNNRADIFVHDHQTGVTERVSVADDGAEANGFSFSPTISADGRYVAFISGASNLVAGDTNNRVDVFVHDRETGTTTRLSVASDGAEANNHIEDSVISADGRYVVFRSRVSNLVPSDTNNARDIFVAVR